MNEIKTGILLQGRVSDWTIPIIEELQVNFPNSEIVLSTWTSYDVTGIPCKVIQSDLPKPTHPYKNTKDHQIIGCQNGLKEMKADIILRCRSDQFIHNPNIFKIFLAEKSNDKIMHGSLGVLNEITRDYWISDFCQLSSRETLLDFWNSMPLFDGRYEIASEIYFTKNYVLKFKNDYRPWKITQKEYFISKDFNDDFQIEHEKAVKPGDYQESLVHNYRGIYSNI